MAGTALNVLTRAPNLKTAQRQTASVVSDDNLSLRRRAAPSMPAENRSQRKVGPTGRVCIRKRTLDVACVERSQQGACDATDKKGQPGPKFHVDQHCHGSLGPCSAQIALTRTRRPFAVIIVVIAVIVVVIVAMLMLMSRDIGGKSDAG